MDGVLQLDSTEKDLVHESFVVDTRDHEDHTFCGMMVDVACDTLLPAEYLEIQSIWVRGKLGPMTVWCTPQTFEGKQEEKHLWAKVYEGTHEASMSDYAELKFSEALRLLPGESCGLYVHSGLPGDEAIVYDNQRKHITYEDRVFKVYPGYAHLSNKPFGKHGFWGRPWRSHREFVGRMSYGVRWKMWQPNQTHRLFPIGFQQAVMAMIMASRRPESLMYLLQDEIVFFIMNKCSWDWFGTEMDANGDADEDNAEAADWGPTTRAAAARANASSSSSVGGMASLYSSLLGLHHGQAGADSDEEEEGDSDEWDGEYYGYDDDDDDDEDEDEESDEDDEGEEGEEQNDDENGAPAVAVD